MNWEYMCDLIDDLQNHQSSKSSKIFLVFRTEEEKRRYKQQHGIDPNENETKDILLSTLQEAPQFVRGRRIQAYRFVK